MSHASDRLDRLARWAARARRDSGGVSPTAEGDPSAKRMTRATATKLAISGLTSVWFGALRVPPALANDAQDACFQTCFTKYRNAADRAIKVCEDVFDDPKSIFNTSPPDTWKRWNAIVKRGHWGVLSDIAKKHLWEACEVAAIRRMDNGWDRCEDACRETCPGSSTRSPSRVGAAPACRGTEPPPPSTPKLPPPPGIPPGIPPVAYDNCLNCMSVGGQCCPASYDPFMVCSNPYIGCR